MDQLDCFCNSDHKPVREDPIFKEPYEIPSNLNREVLPDPPKSFEDMCRKAITNSKLTKGRLEEGVKYVHR